jgi:hypothetical protein
MRTLDDFVEHHLNMRDRLQAVVRHYTRKMRAAQRERWTYVHASRDDQYTDAERSEFLRDAANRHAESLLWADLTRSYLARIEKDDRDFVASVRLYR